MAYALHIPRFPRRSPLLGFIVLMHTVVIYYINQSLGVWEIPIFRPDVELVDIAPESKPVEPVKALTPKIPTGDQLVIDPEELPPIELAEEPPVAAALEPGAITTVETGAGMPDTRPALDPRHPIGKPAYPPHARREGQEGLVVLNACVQPDGRLNNVRLARSSGYALLDTAAVSHFARAGVRMRPGTLDGRPVTQCLNVPIRFSLRDP